MPRATKIATCSFCGTRAALVLQGRDRHELTCSACGAPLHDLKMLRSDAVDQDLHRAPVRGRKGAHSKTRGLPAYPGPEDVHATPLAAWEKRALAGTRKVKKKKRKSFAKKLFEEAFDVLEDIFD